MEIVGYLVSDLVSGDRAIQKLAEILQPKGWRHMGGDCCYPLGPTSLANFKEKDLVGIDSPTLEGRPPREARKRIIDVTTKLKAGSSLARKLISSLTPFAYGDKRAFTSLGSPTPKRRASRNRIRFETGRGVLGWSILFVKKVFSRRRNKRAQLRRVL